MKTIRYIISVIVLILCACTQNSGRIGDLFGSWLLDSMTVDGKNAALPEGTYTTFSFQGNVIMVSLIEGPELATKQYGTWIRTDNNIILDFTHSSDEVDNGNGGYKAPIWLGFPPSGWFDLYISTLNSGKMTLIWNDTNGHNRVYTFTKTW